MAGRPPPPPPSASKALQEIMIRRAVSYSNLQALPPGSMSAAAVGAPHLFKPVHRRSNSLNVSYPGASASMPNISEMDGESLAPPARNLTRPASRAGTFASSFSGSVASSPQIAAMAVQKALVATGGPADVEVYGFVMYLASFIGFVCYLIWAYVPDAVLERLGIAYYPDKWWAIALPMYFMLCLVFVFIATFAFNLANTPPLGSVHTITDEHATVLTDFASQVPRQDERVAPLSDIPISVVNRILFHPIVEEELPGRNRKAAAARLG